MNNSLSAEDRQAILDILVKQTGVNRAQLTPQARIQADLGADSLTIAEMILLLEDRFTFSIPDEYWDKVATVGDLFELVAKLKTNPAAAATYPLGEHS